LSVSLKDQGYTFWSEEADDDFDIPSHEKFKRYLKNILKVDLHVLKHGLLGTYLCHINERT